MRQWPLCRARSAATGVLSPHALETAAAMTINERPTIEMLCSSSVLVE
jgi:hypothetical protein